MRLTSYKIISGSDGSQCKVVNWYEDAVQIQVTPAGHVKFYDSEFCSIHECRKVYVPQQGEHLEVTYES